jgi:hypothetical protein
VHDLFDSIFILAIMIQRREEIDLPETGLAGEVYGREVSDGK